jgi:energy-coupling factor transport system ATP-binding protein
MDKAVIRLENLRFSYPKSGFSLRCDELSFYKGEAVAIRGRNGSGKTTLSRLMCGVLRPDSGHAWIGDEDSRGLSLGKIGKTVGILFQEPSRQLFAATAWEELTFLAEFTGADRNETEEKADALLDRFGLSHLKERSVFRLSKGEQQRISLCALFMQSPSFLILDEPTSGLDSAAQKLLFETLETLLQNGVGLAVISHAELPETLISRVITVEDGVVSE